jgi:hypothetical protein
MGNNGSWLLFLDGVGMFESKCSVKHLVADNNDGMKYIIR